MSLANPWVLPMAAMGLVMVGVGVLAWHSRSFVRELGVCAVVGALYALPYAAEMASTSLDAKLLWHRVAWVGIAGLPPAALSVALRFARRPLGRRAATCVWGVAGVFVLLSTTNELHFWLETPPRLTSYGDFAMRRQDAGWGFLVFVFYGYACVLSALVVIVGVWLSGSEIYRRQSRLLAFGTVLPVIGNLVYLFIGVPGIRELDPTPLLYGAACLVYARSLRGGLLEIVPVARNLMFEEMDAAMFVVDRRGRVIDANPAARAAFGHEGAHDPMTPLATFAAGAPELRAALEGERTGELGELSVGSRTYAVRATPVSAGEGRLVYLRDVTAWVEAEAAQREALEAAASAQRARDGFIARMTHELRTPLHGVIGSTEVLLASLAPSDERRAYAETALLSARVLLDLVDEVLEFQRIDRDALALVEEPFDLAELLVEIVRSQTPTAMRKHLHLELLGGEQPVWVKGDHRRLRQIVLNFLGNALKFTERGVVRVRLTSQAHGEGTAFRIEVDDEGPGIPESELARVFEPFVQLGDGATHHGGAGLGLSICRQLADLLGARVALENLDGGGLRASVSGVLERAEPQGEGADRSCDASTTTLAGMRSFTVFVVDDHPIGREVIGWLLERVGVAFEVFRTPRALLAAVDERVPDLILCDVHMPGGGGGEVARALRDAGHTALPIVAFTADARPEVRARCLAAGMDDLLAKPCTVEQLRACLARHLPLSASAPAREATWSSPVELPSEGAIPEVRELFLRSVPDERARLRAALDANDAEEVRRLAHALAGAAAFAGYPCVVAACRAVVDSDSCSPLSGVEPLLRRLDELRESAVREA